MSKNLKIKEIPCTDVAIVNYNSGNLYNIGKAVSHLGHNPVCINTPKHLSEYSHIILPGVGSFSEAMKVLKKSGIADELKNCVEDGALVLGICLGMHLLCAESSEFGNSKGLSILDGRVRSIPKFDNFKVPNVGNYKLVVNKTFQADWIINPPEDYYYFCHSFMVQDFGVKNCSHNAQYGNLQIPALLTNNRNVFGVQFHPELSGQSGLSFIKSFLDKNRT